MIIVGMDQAPRGIGFAHGPPGSVPVRGWAELPDYGDNTARLSGCVFDWATAFLKSVGAEAVYFEQILVRKFGLHMPTLYKQFAVVAGIEFAARQLGLHDYCYQVMVADWRTEFYAGARPSKNCDELSTAWKDMAVAECARRNWYTDNHNIAEACGLWDYGCKCADKVYRHRARVSKRRQQSAADEARRAVA